MKRILLFISTMVMAVLLLTPDLHAQSRVTGQVLDANNEGLVGVSVTVKGTTRGVITGAEGNFAIDAQPNSQLVFSYIGYQTQTLPVGNRTQFNITLAEDAALLNEVVVVGYGVTRKSDLTSAVGTVDAKQLEDLPVARVDQALQGRAAGVMVTANNGSPGARSSIRIRGGNSVNADNEPLYVIDGFIVGTGFNLNNLNTNDVESIEVLKDATAISIYGTRGANGVILITTKTGKGVTKGKPKVSVNYYTGLQQLARKIQFLNGPERIDYHRDLSNFSGEVFPFDDLSDFGDTDWQEEISQLAPMHNADVSVAGSTDDVSYYLSANVFDQQGIIKATGIKRYSLRTNLDFNLSKNLRAGIRLNGSFIRQENDKVNLWTMRQLLTSYKAYNDDGSFADYNPVQGGPLDNPLADIALRTDFTLSTNLLTTAYIEFNPFENVTVRSTIGPKIDWYKRNQYDAGNLPVSAASQIGGEASINSGFSYDILQENTITWNKEFNSDNRLDLLGGFTWQKGSAENFNARTRGISIDALSYDALSLGDPLSYRIGSNFNDSRQLVSWLGRANYAFKNKYLFTLVGRVDGASVYSGSNNAYAFFPSASAAWRIIDEPFMKNQNLFTNLKLRASYGSAGKESIDPYNTLAVLTNGVIIFNDNQYIGIRRGRPANPDLKWETTDQLDVGLEFGFLDNRITGEIDYYYKKTRDLLLARQIPRATGFDTKLENVGSLQNQGLELILNTVNVNNSDFRWESTLTLSGNRSKVLDLAGVDEIVLFNADQGGPGAKLIVGQPVGVFTGVQFLGTYKSQAEIDADGDFGIRQVVGGGRFKDENGDGTINNDDHVVMGNPEPLFFGGLNNSFSYKNLTLDIFLQGTYGNDIYHEFNSQALFGRSGSNQYKETLNRWTPDNPTSDVPRAGGTIAVADVRSNSSYLEDGSHLRLKNIRLAYNLPLKTNFVNDVSVYMVGTNLFLASDFRGYDPEASRFGTDPTVRGVIRNQYPNAKTVTFGVKANF